MHPSIIYPYDFLILLPLILTIVAIVEVMVYSAIYQVELSVQFATHQGSNEHMDSTHGKKRSNTNSVPKKMSLQDRGSSTYLVYIPGVAGYKPARVADTQVEAASGHKR